MRVYVKGETISDWHGDEPRMRDDALDYVAAELLEDLKRMNGKPSEKVLRRPEHKTNKSALRLRRASTHRRPRSAKAVRLVAAE
jgi:hypothetical protein